jgi:hypothetical protein
VGRTRHRHRGVASTIYGDGASGVVVWRFEGSLYPTVFGDKGESEPCRVCARGGTPSEAAALHPLLPQRRLAGTSSMPASHTTHTTHGRRSSIRTAGLCSEVVILRQTRAYRPFKLSCIKSPSSAHLPELGVLDTTILSATVRALVQNPFSHRPGWPVLH